MEYLADYLLFLGKTVTITGGLLILVIMAVGLSQRSRHRPAGHLEVRNLNREIRHVHQALEEATLPAEWRKAKRKARSKEEKAERKQQKAQLKKRQKERRKDGGEAEKPEEKKRLFVIDFVGDIQASGVDCLRREVSAIVNYASSGQDEVLLRLESAGGVVDGYGLAASQLGRFTDAGIRLTVAVDRVAASGGYMMACLGDRIIAAPFALLGSIGVASQVPNLHRLLKKHDVDVDIITAGEHKRTLTLFGENTEKGRDKFQEEINDVHLLFKDFVKTARPVVDIDAVATGEAWFGSRALERKLVDDLCTSDEHLLRMSQEREVFRVEYVENFSRIDQLMDKFFRTGLALLAGRVPKGGRTHRHQPLLK